DFNIAGVSFNWRVRVKDNSGFANAWSGWSAETVFYVANDAPTLSWTGESNYVSDGLNPETNTESGIYVFRVKYADADNDVPKSGYPRVHIKRGSSAITNSPFTMSYVSGNYSSGAIYTYSATLSGAGSYAYYFEAYDLYDAEAAGEAAVEKMGPVIITNAPEVKKVKVYNRVIKPEENENCFVSYNLSEDAVMTVKVYNTLGQEIRELYRGTSGAGLNTMSWDGTDSSGSKVSSGVYYIHIEGGGISQQKKVVVIR
ncbi:MAG: T9SS type A sorting domain-containing protein, partial [Elusimicrobia bacterium]|nr:T9SS type A sorting domain-containing protein [Elusimicrobiota bacterium]